MKSANIKISWHWRKISKGTCSHVSNACSFTTFFFFLQKNQQRQVVGTFVIYQTMRYFQRYVVQAFLHKQILIKQKQILLARGATPRGDDTSRAMCACTSKTAGSTFLRIIRHCFINNNFNNSPFQYKINLISQFETRNCRLDRIGTTICIENIYCNFVLKIIKCRCLYIFKNFMWAVRQGRQFEAVKLHTVLKISSNYYKK